MINIKKPRPKLPAESESVIQVAIVKALKKLALEIYSCPNGGYRLSLTAALKLRAEGLMRGVPDLHILLPGGRIAYFEVKATKGRLSPEQVAFGNRAKELGAFWAEVRSVDDVMAKLSEWGLLPISPRRCEAKQFSDTMVCERCDLRWDTNDSDEPACKVAA